MMNDECGMMNQGDKTGESQPSVSTHHSSFRTPHSRKSYPRCKPSGIDWLGDVPEHWETRRLKYSADLINQKIDGAESDLPYMGLEHIESWTGKRLGQNGEASSDGEANHFRRGDVLFCKLRPYLAKAYAADSEGICTGELLVLRPKAVEQMFLLDFMLNPDFIAIVDSSTYGAKMPRANWDFIGNLPTLIPPSDEQTAIAAFLDRETARIDALIAKKQRQIELLREKRASLISHAVTGKMLNDECGVLSSEFGSTHHSSFRIHHSMRPSGIDWLGDVPEHWTITRLGRIARNLQTGPFGSQLHAKDYVDDGVPVINPANIQDGEIVPNPKCSVGDEKYSELSRHVLREGDIVFARRGAMGRCALVTSDTAGCLCGTGSIRIRLNSSLACPRYVASFLGTPGVRDHLQLESVGSTMDNLNTGILSRIPCAVPPVPEQLSISNRIDRETTRINRIASTVVQSIDLLREYRTSLISAAVTGKIDVRQQAE